MIGSNPKQLVNSITAETCGIPSFGISQRANQVYAVQQMVKCIEDDAGNGYVWHTNGSGKTLSSSKASPSAKLSYST